VLTIRPSPSVRCSFNSVTPPSDRTRFPDSDLPASITLLELTSHPPGPERGPRGPRRSVLRSALPPPSTASEGTGEVVRPAAQRLLGASSPECAPSANRRAHPPRPTGSGGLPPDPEARAHALDRRESAGVLRCGVVAVSDQTAIAGPNARNWDSASRPSKTNCTSNASESLPAGEGSFRGYWWKEKNALVDEFVEDFSNRAARPVSVRGGTKLREECTSEKYDGGYRSKTWSSVLNEFLKWYNDYCHAHLVFESPNG